MNQSDYNNEAAHYYTSDGNTTVVGVVFSSTKVKQLEDFLRHPISNGSLAIIIMQYEIDINIFLSLDDFKNLTSMNVVYAKDEMDIEKNCIYLLPLGVDMEIRENKLFLVEYPANADQSMSVNRFLFTLANRYGSKAIIVVFPGQGIDGTRGIDAVNIVNGMVIIATRKSPKSSFLSTTATLMEPINYLLEPSEIPSHISEHLSFYNFLKQYSENPTDDEWSDLFVILKQNTGIDFSYYKENSILRRIRRRMEVQRMNSLTEYNQFLNNNAEEIVALQKDLLIGVTHFFRDPEAFEVLAERVLPAIIEKGLVEKQIRIWVAGCSTGEEAYSLAILIKDLMDNYKADVNVKIFATDLDNDAIQYASRGIYSEDISKRVAPEQLKAYFMPIGNQYQVNKEIRQMVIFAQHNILKDPPFIQLDLILCRNVLIYLHSEIQRKVISLFQHSLNPDAFLCLGPSESLGKLEYLFTTIDSKWHIHQSKDVGEWVPANYFEVENKLNPKRSSFKNKVYNRLKETDRILKLDIVYAAMLEEYVSPFIIIDENDEIVLINGHASTYLVISKGKPNHHLLKMLPEDLSIPIRTALHRVRKEHAEVIYKDIMLRDENGNHAIHLTAKPMILQSISHNLTILFFEDVGISQNQVINDNTNQQPTTKYVDIASNIHGHIDDLEQELFQAKESLQTVVEELENTNEEFQMTNEELIVSNEELQSTNEELQSVNEELMAVNNEYQYKIKELTELNNDINNFFASSNVATLFLDTKMNVRKFTPAVLDIINLMDQDIGRSISDISHNLKYDNWLSDTHQVFNTGIAFEREVQSHRGKWFILKIFRYHAVDHSNLGIVVTLIDITAIKQAADELRVLSYAIEQSPVCIIITDTSRNIKYVNTQYTTQTGFTADELIDTKLSLTSDRLSKDEIEDIWTHAIEGVKWSGELLNNTNKRETYYESASILPIRNERQEITHVLKISEDMTERNEAREMLLQSEMLSVVGQLAAGIAHEIRNPLTVLKGFTQLIESETENKNYLEIMQSEFQRIESIIDELLLLVRPRPALFDKIDVTHILNNVILLMETQARLKNVEIITKFSLPSPIVNCVQNQLKQVFINVLKNGIESMPNGGYLIVTLKWTAEDAIAISITDQGVGIEQENIPKIGVPFYTTKEHGTGLGLVVSHKIIENHKGNLVLKSMVGKGTVVDILMAAEPHSIK